ncbi:Ribosomal protein L18e/L15P [Corchorus olitorius]|uniref:Ribosomal protein L18e/L15P n=1 Tax=Corchorus olitorius TaxID=93759 RepID=A0A1R3KG00_9ROSI|nr:Ribosomal protein L18e/L15P [Corchorus olitorius]
MHHHRILFDKYHPWYFGKVGMRYFHKLHNKFYCPIVNIDKLWSLIPEDVKAKGNKDSAPMTDMTQFGYLKVLRKGVLPENQPIVLWLGFCVSDQNEFVLIYGWGYGFLEKVLFYEFLG